MLAANALTVAAYMIIVMTAARLLSARFHDTGFGRALAFSL